MCVGVVVVGSQDAGTALERSAMWSERDATRHGRENEGQAPLRPASSLFATTSSKVKQVIDRVSRSLACLDLSRMEDRGASSSSQGTMGVEMSGSEAALGAVAWQSYRAVRSARCILNQHALYSLEGWLYCTASMQIGECITASAALDSHSRSLEAPIICKLRHRVLLRFSLPFLR